MTGADNKKIRIFCAITLGEVGGAQQFLIQLVSHLDPSRYDIQVVTGAQGRQDISSQLPEHVQWDVAGHLKRDIAPISDIKAVRQLKNMMREHQPDIVLLMSSKAGFVGAKAAHALRKELPGLQVVYRIGGWTFNDPWPAYKRTLFTWMERLSAVWKDVIVVNNRHDLEQARELKIRPRHGVMMIHNGIDPYRHALSRADARQELVERIEQTVGARPNLRFVVGAIANFYPTKGLDVLLNAAANTPEEVQFVVIGDGPLRGDIEQRIVQHNLEHRVFLTGVLPDARRYLPAFDVFALASRKEGFPWVILEAMAAKVPIVATKVGAVVEALKDGVSGLLVAPEDSGAIAQALTRLHEREQLRGELAIRAHQELLAKYTLRGMMDRYERLFTALTHPDAQ